MFNVTVIDGKKIVKCIITVGIIILLSLIVKQPKNKDNSKKTVIQNVVQKIGSKSFSNCMDINIASLRYFNNSNNIDKPNNSLVNNILGMELSANNRIIAKSVDEEITSEGNIQSNIECEPEISNTEIPETVVTQVIDEKNMQMTYTNNYEGAEVKNKSGYELTVDDLTPTVDLENKKDIIIFHTHTSESYTSSDAFSYQMTRKLQNYRFKLYCCKSW